MKLTLTHPLRDACLRLKMLCPAPPPIVKTKHVPLRVRPKAHRTTAFFELP